MRISQIRDEIIAPLVPVPPQVLRQRTDMLYREATLRGVLPGRRQGGGDNAGLTATQAASALVLLAAMLGGSREKIGAKTVRLWRAKCVTPTGNPIEKRYKTVGDVLTRLLGDADIRARLIFFEVDDGVPHLSLLFGPPDILVSTEPLSVLEWQARIDRAVAQGEVSRTFFAPYTPKQWKKRVDKAFERGAMAHVCRLPPTTLNKIAELISQEACSTLGVPETSGESSVIRRHPGGLSKSG